MRFVGLTLVAWCAVGCHDAAGTQTAGGDRGASSPTGPEDVGTRTPGAPPTPVEATVECRLEAHIRDPQAIVLTSPASDEATRERELLAQLCTTVGRPSCSFDDFYRPDVIGRWHFFYPERRLDGHGRAGTHPEACGAAWREVCETAGLDPESACSDRVEIGSINGVIRPILTEIGLSPGPSPRLDDAFECEARHRDRGVQRRSDRSWAYACLSATLDMCFETACDEGPTYVDGIPQAAYPGRFPLGPSLAEMLSGPEAGRPGPLATP